MVNAQEYINEKYPKEERSKIRELDLRNQNLEGFLDLSDFEDLEKLNCGTNGLTSLNLNDCLNLKKLLCYDNRLEELEINNLTNLEHLDCRDNYLKDLKFS